MTNYAVLATISTQHSSRIASASSSQQCVTAVTDGFLDGILRFF
jgi:hypothetical protein